MALNKVVLQVVLLVAFASSEPLFRKKLTAIQSLVYDADDDYRLPNNTAPISYVIKLVPYIVVGNFTYDGEAKILLKVLAPTSTITLHTNELTYDETLTTLVSQNGVSHNVTSHTYVTRKHFLIIRVRDELPVGNYTLSFSFVGILSNLMSGFYRTSYTNASGDKVWLAATQFEATNARQAFPCYDEPALKATFEIAIKHDPKFHALSNTPAAKTYTDSTDGKVWTVFEPTPIMSTYLVAFVVSDFSAIKSPDESYNVWSRPEVVGEAQYVYSIGPRELAELEDFTNVTYPLRKMDQIAIPEVAGGAMENWGLVVYSERMFYYNENTSTLFEKQRIATAMSHELAHQWFGNLVSPAWWKYLWLNEGLATYFEYRTTHAVEKNWRLMDQFVVNIQQAEALAKDCSKFAYPMNRNVVKPNEILMKFNRMTYAKAASVLRMTSHFLTENVFKTGLTKYLKTNAYGTATSDDLFNALQEAASEAKILPARVHVKEVLDTWVEQSGYPILTVTRNYTTGETEITQERFLNENSDNDYEYDDYHEEHDYPDQKWWIPINWVSQASPDFTSTIAMDWIRGQDESVIIGSFNVTEWVIINKQQTGYYRVNYDDTNWGMIARYLNSSNYLNIHVLNRAALIDDAFTLAKDGQLSWPVMLDLISYLHREIDYIPWCRAEIALNFLDRSLANTNEYELFRAYFAFLSSNLFDSVGIEETDSDDHLIRLYRADVIDDACRRGLKRCRASAEAKLVAWLDNSTASPIDPNLQTIVICAGLRSANATTWNRALDRYLTSKSITEKTALMAGLGCSEDEAIVNAWLNTIFNSTTGLNISESSDAFVQIVEGSVYNVDRAFDFVVNNFDRIISYFGDSTGVQLIVADISYQIKTQAQLDKLNAFYAAHPTILGNFDSTAVSLAESTIAWNLAHQEEINAWIVNWVANLESSDSWYFFIPSLSSVSLKSISISSYLNN